MTFGRPAVEECDTLARAVVAVDRTLDGQHARAKPERSALPRHVRLRAFVRGTGYTPWTMLTIVVT
jgi:hypothetical protein